MPTRLLSALGLSLPGALLLAGCASHPQRTSETQATAPAPPAAAAAPAPVIPRHAKPPVSATPSVAAPPAPPGEMVGVASCDQYLSTYKACHRAAGIYPPDQIDSRYEAMRNSLLRDAADPAKRPTLDQRCRALSKLLTNALQGKSCDAAPAVASSSGS